MLSAEDVDVLIDELKAMRALVVGLQLKVHALEGRPLGLVYRQMWDGSKPPIPMSGHRLRQLVDLHQNALGETAAGAQSGIVALGVSCPGETGKGKCTCQAETP